VRLDVLHLDAGRAAEGLQRADLVAHQRLDLVGLERHRAPPEAQQVRVAGLGADRHAGAAAERDRCLHHPEVAGVESARQVGAGQVRNQSLVLAERPASEALAEVGVEVH
jgi:hypothetical protein